MAFSYFKMFIDVTPFYEKIKFPIYTNNTNNILNDIFIFLTESMQKITPSREKVITLQKPV